MLEHLHPHPRCIKMNKSPRCLYMAVWPPGQPGVGVEVDSLIKHWPYIHGELLSNKHFRVITGPTFWPRNFQIIAFRFLHSIFFVKGRLVRSIMWNFTVNETSRTAGGRLWCGLQQSQHRGVSPELISLKTAFRHWSCGITTHTYAPFYFDLLWSPEISYRVIIYFVRNFPFTPMYTQEVAFCVKISFQDFLKYFNCIMLQERVAWNFCIQTICGSE